MCLNIDRGTAKEEIERCQDSQKPVVAVVPEKQHTDGAYTDVRTWESCCRTFAGCFGIFNKVIEDTVSISRTLETVLMMVEEIMHIREDACCDVL